MQSPPPHIFQYNQNLTSQMRCRTQTIHSTSVLFSTRFLETAPCFSHLWCSVSYLPSWLPCWFQACQHLKPLVLVSSLVTHGTQSQLNLVVWYRFTAH